MHGWNKLSLFWLEYIPDGHSILGNKGIIEIKDAVMRRRRDGVEEEKILRIWKDYK